MVCCTASGKLLYLPMAVVSSELAMKSLSHSLEGLWSICRGIDEGANNALKTSPSLPLTPPPLLCRTCESGAQEGQSFSRAQPPSSKGLWRRSSCLWTGTGLCADPTGNHWCLLLPTPWRCWSKDQQWTHVVQVLVPARHSPRTPP